MNARFFSEVPLVGDSAILSEQEAHHLLHVLRASVGDEVVLFDGPGVECRARLVQTSRRDVQLAIESRAIVDRESSCKLTLAVALPKGERQKVLVEKCVELGVHRLVPLETERSVAQPREAALVRLRRAVIEASKQCGRNRLMPIDEPARWDEWYRLPPAVAPRWMLHPYLAADPGLLEHGGAPAAEIYAAVGPEGGWTDDEVERALSAGWTGCCLGARILRIETAALAIASRICCQ